MTTWASPGDIERATQQWTDNQLACRTYGHTWRPRTVTHRPGVYTVVQRCSRCTTVRRQEINDQGYPISGWRMTYQQGYLLDHVGRIGYDGRAVLRITNLRSMTVTEEPDE